MKITCVTPACKRPEAWVLSEGYMRRQTRQPDQWIVLDNDDPPTKCTMGQQVIYLPGARTPGSVDMINKLKEAFAPGIITGDVVIFWENDDWYAPNWIETCAKELETCQLFGEGRAHYYNVRERWWFQHANMDHASLCATA